MKVLVTDRYPTENLGALKAIDAEVVRSESFQPTAEELKGAEALLIRSRTKVGDKLLSKAKDLKVIITATSGFDHIDLEACEKQNVKVAYTPNANAQSAAEHTLFLMLGALRKISSIEMAKKQRQWKDKIDTGNELYGKTVGIIGLGRVGKAVANLLTPFKTKTLAYDPYLDGDTIKDFHAETTNMTELLKAADIVTLHVPLTKETRNMIAMNTIDELSSDTIIVNCSRGPVVNEPDLLEALDNNDLRAAALDVFQFEPLKEDSPIRKHPKIYWTPHVGAMTDEALTKASQEAIQKLIHFVQTNELDDSLPGSAPWLK